MAITQVDPQDWKSANVVLVDSDAPDNHHAMMEIEDWAGECGFARTHEYWLREIFKSDGTRVFRGICYRITPEIKRSSAIVTRRIAERAARNPIPRRKTVKRSRAKR